MSHPRTPDIHSALVIKADRLYAEMLRQTVLAHAPHAQVIVANTVKTASVALSRISFDLVLAGLDGGLDGDVLELLADCTVGAIRPRRVFVIGSQIENRLLAVLPMLPISGVFDSATDAPDRFAVAIQAVIAGERYLSPSVSERLHGDGGDPQSVCQHLSSTEQLVLAVLGDGCDDLTAGQALGLSPATISTFRRKLHRKLRVQHRGELIRVAAQNGYVRFTPSGIVRPGFAILAAACIARKRKRRATTAAAVAAFLHGNELSNADCRHDTPTAA